ncbi:MAG: 5-(carboxyamino)imidazole ribonucleotide mutase [Nitrospirota bacterium]|nr:5-(carboxyamino)imidazole ribonucleotide mutase [Nitrospirota bacterium]
MTKQPAPNDRPIVGIVMGSDSDWPVMEQAAKALDQFGVSWEATVASAHRTPERVRAWVDAARHKNYHAIIVGAGAAAHLGGVIAAECNIPVIGVPIEATSLNGLDALLSIVQMPGGVPVACMAVGKAGAKNAGVFAAQIIGRSNTEVAARLEIYREEMVREVEAKAAALERRIAQGQ